MNEHGLVKYGARSAVSRWFDDYWDERDKAALPWLVVTILVGLVLVGPRILLGLLSWLPLSRLGNSGASIHAHQTILAVACVLGGAACIAAIRPYLKPAYLELSLDGIRKIWSIHGLRIPGNLFAWERLATINLMKAPGKIDMRSYRLCFGTANSPDVFSVLLGEIESDEQREALGHAIAVHGRAATVHPEVFEVLQPKRELSFTELWLDALSAPPERQRLLPLSAGAVLDSRYEVIRPLGAGGQGSVYLANDRSENRQVVLKETILPVYADIISRKQSLEAFHKEAFALELVKHERIVKFYGSFVCDHRAYLVLEYIQGSTLSQVIKTEGAASPDRVVAMGIEMCNMLSALHGLKPPLVHRDFTPDNLLVGQDGKLILIDFAVAVAGDVESADAAGKAAYMAPEQFKGRPTAQSDIYALGGTLFYALTGMHPEPLTESHPRLVNSQVPEALNDIVARATRLDVTDRAPSVDAVRAALETIRA